MSDDTSKSANSKSASDDGKPLAGQRLAAARRANDISMAEIAKALHLDEPKVQALEENQFEMLGAPVFAKGHLRKYAELVGVPIDEVLADYYQVYRSPGAPPVVGPPRHKPTRNLNLGPWLVALIAVLLVGGALYWLTTRDLSSNRATPTESLEPPVESAPTPAADEPSESLSEPELPDAGDDNAAAATVETTAAAATASPGPAEPETIVDDEDLQTEVPVPAVGGVEIAMQFSGDCWTEVTDADGNRLFFGLGRDGMTITRTGVPPLQALFGDFNNVTVTVDGQNYPLSRAGRRGNTARVTIDENP